MSVDKFGRYSRKKDKNLRGPKGEGFNLTPDGDYDIQRKRLRNVWEPTEDLDAVNFKTHVATFLNCISRQDGEFDAQNTRICNIAQPLHNKDAVTKEYMESHTPKKLESSYSLHQYRMQDVALPENDGDAVNVSYLKANTISKTESGSIDIQGALIQNVGSPMSDKDAVNLTYLKSNTIFKTPKGTFDVKNTVVKNLAPPVDGGDAVNKAYLDQNIPIRSTMGWNFRNKQLSQVASPTHVHDAVTVDYLQKHSLSLVGKVAAGNEPHYDAGDRRLRNLKRPQVLKDAVNKIYLKESLADLALAIFKVIKSNERASISPDEGKEWRKQFVEGTATLDELFNDEIPIIPSADDKVHIITTHGGPGLHKAN